MSSPTPWLSHEIKQLAAAQQAPVLHACPRFATGVLAGAAAELVGWLITALSNNALNLPPAEAAAAPLLTGLLLAGARWLRAVEAADKGSAQAVPPLPPPALPAPTDAL